MRQKAADLSHKRNYVVLCQQPQSLQLPPVLLTGGHDVDARGVDAAVTQDIRQLGDVLFQIVERPGEELAQIVREDFVRINFCPRAELFHRSPDVAAVQRPSRAGAEDDAAADSRVPRVAQQERFEPAGEQNFPVFVLAGHADLAPAHGLHREIPQLRDADAGGADGLHQKPQPPVSLRGPQKAQVFRAAQLPLRSLVDLPLHAAQPHAAVRQAAEGEKAVHRRQHGIHGPQGVAAREQMPLVGDRPLSRDALPAEPAQKALHIADVLCNRDAAFFFFGQVFGKGIDLPCDGESFVHIISPLCKKAVGPPIGPTAAILLAPVASEKRGSQDGWMEGRR